MPAVDRIALQMAERRERILSAAREMIAQSGYEALTMRELARASQVTVPTIYNLIGAKEQVLFAAVEDQTADFLRGIPREAAASPAERVLVVVEAVARELLRMPSYYRMLLELLYVSDAAQGVRGEVDRALNGELESALSELDETGCLASWVDPKTLRERLRARLDGISLQWSHGLLPDARLLDTMLYDVALPLVGATTGASRDAFQEIARNRQRGASRGPRPTSRKSKRGAGA